MFEYKYVAWSERLPFKSKSGFDTNSLPYILATDFPFLVWSQLPWQAKRILIIADSGDNILTLWPLGVKEIIAVDIAQKACFLNELKGVALKELDFTSFRALFAPAFKNPFFPEVTPTDKQNIYFRLRDFLSEKTRQWLDRKIGKGMFPTPNWREVSFTHLIPHFADETAFKITQKNFKPYPLFNLPLEVALKELEAEYDFIYLSNIPEYIKQELRAEDKDEEIIPVLEELYNLAFRRLRPEGYILFYSFGNAISQPSLIAEEREIASRLGLNLKTIPITFSTPLIKNSHFVHTLGIMTN